MSSKISTLKVFGTFAVVLIAVLCFIFFTGRHESPKEMKEKNGTGMTHAETTETIVDSKEITLREMHINNLKAKIEAENEAQMELINQVSELRDSEDTQDQALALALELAEKGNFEAKKEALKTFEWIGGKKALMSSIKLMTEGDEVGMRATQVIDHLIQENLMTGEELMDIESWKALFGNLYNEVDIDSYMILLSGYSVEESFPVLLELAEAGREKISSVAKEYLEFVASGQEFGNLDDARKWFKQYQEQQAKEAAKEALKEAEE